MIKTYDNYDENDDFDDDFEYEEANDELELIDDELYKIGDEDDFPIIKTPPIEFLQLLMATYTMSPLRIWFLPCQPIWQLRG